MSEEIRYDSRCQACDDHKTERGIWLSYWHSIQEMFPTMSEENQIKLLECWFTQYKLDERTDKIQGFKKTNIKEINKNGK